jgi:putative ABC transport system permease protein
MLFRRRSRDLDDEIAAHLAMARRDGADPASFGNATLIKEVTRETWGWVWLDALLLDLRYGLRMMRRAPGFTAVAVLSLALGIGANTAIFSLIDSLMLRRLPVRDPDQLVQLLTRGGKDRWESFSWPAYLHLRDRNTVFSGLLAAPTDRLYTRVDGRESERLASCFVSGDAFDLLGIHPAIGRLITPDDDRVASPAAVAVVSWTYWQSRFGGDRSVLGTRLQIEDSSATIVGVLPRGFTGLQTGRVEDVALPLAMAPVVRPRFRFGDYGAKWIRLVGRLKPGVSIQSARAEMNVLVQPLLDQEAGINDSRKRPDWSIEVEPAAAGLTSLRDRFSKPLLILMGAVGMLLLISCANVAGLLLARASAREREMAVRFSLGASRLRIARQALTESLLLSAIAAALGVGLAYFGADALLAMMNSGRMPVDLRIRPDARILAFTAAVALLTAVLFGIAPALRSAAPAPADSARVTDSRRRRLFGRSLVVAQVALSIILLTAAGLFVENLSALNRIDLGFRRDHVLLVPLDPAHTGYSPDALGREYRELLRRFEAIPGVRSASLSWIAPISGGGSSRLPRSVDGRALERGESRIAYLNWVAPRYFDTLGIPLIAGRDFRPDEPPGTAIVSQAFARRFFGNSDPIGRRFGFDGASSLEIVGLTADSRYMDIREQVPLNVYLSAFEGDRGASQFVLRTSVEPGAVTADVRRAVREQLPSVAIGPVTTLDRHIDASIVSERLTATLSGVFGALGALLAAVGLYGLLAYTVARRTQEIGIRVALGATRSGVLAMVLSDAMLIVLSGLVLGIPGAIAGRTLIASWTPGIPAVSPGLVLGGAVLMVAAAILAACVPARKAARIHPMEALRR